MKKLIICLPILTILFTLVPVEVAADNLNESFPQRMDWIAVEMGGVGSWLAKYTLDTPIDFGPTLILRFAARSWQSLFFTPLELGFGMFLSPNNGGFFCLGSNVGIKLRAGSRGQHQFIFGMGLSTGGITVRDTDVCYECEHKEVQGIGLLLSPTIRYDYQTERKLFFGLAARAMIPVTPGWELSPIEHYGVLFLLLLDIGWSSIPGSAE